jgi:predicted nucleic acid-binding protein
MPENKFKPKPSIKVVLDINLIRRKGIAMKAEKSTFEMTDEDDRKFYDLYKAAKAILITGNLKHYPKEDLIMKPADFMEYISK